MNQAQIQITWLCFYVYTLKIMYTCRLLDTVVSDIDIHIIAADFIVKWEELSPVLGVNRVAETSIRRTFGDYDIQKREALRKWRTLKGDAAT